jgi:hypothetical protein
MNSSNRINRETVFGVLALLVGAGFFWSTFDPAYDVLGRGTARGPMFFPRILLVVWLGLAGILTFRGLTGRPLDEGTTDLRHLQWSRIIATIVIVAVGAWAIGIVGFAFAMMLTTAAVSITLGWRRPLILVPLCVGWPLVVWYVFTELLRFSLPSSPWFGTL